MGANNELVNTSELSGVEAVATAAASAAAAAAAVGCSDHSVSCSTAVIIAAVS